MPRATTRTASSASSWRAWSGAESGDRGLLGVEAVIDHWVVPLAREHRVLLLVIDAMSMPVFRELEHDLAWRGWLALVPDGDAGAR